MRAVLKEIIIGSAGILFISIFTGLAVNTFRAEKLELIAEIPWQNIVNEGQATCQKGVESIIEINPEKAVLLLKRDDVIFIDARSSEEFAKGHILGAINIPVESSEEMGLLPLPIDTPKNELFIIYCDSVDCETSKLFARMLFMKGCQYVGILNGGWSMWVASNMPQEPSEWNF